MRISQRCWAGNGPMWPRVGSNAAQAIHTARGLLAGANLADEASYQCNDHQPSEQPGHCIFTGTVDDGTSAARHGSPRSPLRTDPRCFPLSPTQNPRNIAQSNFCGSIPSAASTALCHKCYNKPMTRRANLWLPAKRACFEP
jgi:hypothetical protein